MWTVLITAYIFSILATSCEELTHWKRLWCWDGLWAGGEGDDWGWDDWMVSLTQWTWVWVNSGSWWWTGRPGVLRFTGSQRVRHDWVTELNWTSLPDFLSEWSFTDISGVLKSCAVIVLFPVSFFLSVSICILCLGAPILGTHTLSSMTSFFVLIPVSLRNTLLCLLL